MGKIAWILGLVVAFAIGGGALFMRGDAYSCKKAGGKAELERPAGEEGWKRYVSCEYGFAVNVPKEYQVVRENKNSALFPFREGELLQIVLTDSNPEHAYTVRVLRRAGDANEKAEILSGFKTSVTSNSHYSFERSWLQGSANSAGQKIERSFVAFEPGRDA